MTAELNITLSWQNQKGGGKMKSDELRTSKKMGKQLVFTEIHDYGDKWFIKAVDTHGIIWQHWQILPEFCPNEAAAKQAKTFLTKLGNCKEGDKVFAYCVIRQMANDGNYDGGVYRDVDTIICKM